MIPVRSLFAALAPAASLATPFLADPPRVAVDIAPVHALTARDMAGVGQPGLVVAPTVSPHSYALRPFRRALQQADLVIWVVPQLTPWMQSALVTLAPKAQTLSRLSAQGTLVLALREGPDDCVHDGSDHDGDAHGSHDHDDRGHEDMDRTGAQRPGAGDGHAVQDGLDPHAWLDPRTSRPGRM
ncbi:metal ABC transporter solute-binding protein, Zn/Mn family [Sedimentitalea sp. HM32M-2]|uniref:metal ABC transporter solute-binding protein, Zn/Mn family n=1 Tax=Sedimentitalea sp. HM32M-2 TaxID=3351566 RepID=UPI0036325AD6